MTPRSVFLWYGGDFGEDVLPAIVRSRSGGAGTPSGDVELAFADYDLVAERQLCVVRVIAPDLSEEGGRCGLTGAGRTPLPGLDFLRLRGQ